MTLPKCPAFETSVMEHISHNWEFVFFIFFIIIMLDNNTIEHAQSFRSIYVITKGSPHLLLAIFLM